MRRTLLLIPLLCLGPAGCAATPESPSSSPSSAAAEGGFDPTRFAKCMRENGIPDFPDPEVDGGRIGIRMPDGVTKETADKASKACRELSPDGGKPRKADPAVTAKLRELSKCMRANGVPDFPDPKADGGIEIREGAGVDIDPESESFRNAERACEQYRPQGRAGGKG